MLAKNELRALVASRTPVDEREAESQRTFLSELERLERPFDEEADPCTSPPRPW